MTFYPLLFMFHINKPIYTLPSETTLQIALKIIILLAANSLNRIFKDGVIKWALCHIVIIAVVTYLGYYCVALVLTMRFIQTAIIVSLGDAIKETPLFSSIRNDDDLSGL
jgi:hypothetical protein